MVREKNPGSTHQLRLGSVYPVYPIIYRVSYIPGGAGFLPSTVYRSYTCRGEVSIPIVENPPENSHKLHFFEAKVMEVWLEDDLPFQLLVMFSGSHPLIFREFSEDFGRF